MCLISSLVAPSLRGPASSFCAGSIPQKYLHTSMSWSPCWLYDTSCPKEGAPQLCIRSHLCLLQMSCAGWDHGKQCLSSFCHLGFHGPHTQALPVSPSMSNLCSHRSRYSPLPTGSLALDPLHPRVSRVCHATTKTKPSCPQPLCLDLS